MAESSWPTVAGGRAIDDTQWERIAAGFGGDGILGAATDTPTVYGDASGLLVKVRADKVGLVRGHGWYSGPTELTLSISANGSGLTRVDLVILRYTRSNQEVHIVVKQGTPGSGAPALTLDPPGSGTWEVAIAQVTIVSGASTIGSGSVVTVARYINGVSANARPAWLRHQGGLLTASDRSGSTTLAVAGAWGNTSAPSADGPSPAPPFYSGSELNLVKMTGASRLMCTVNLSGFSSNNASKLTVGIRIGSANYPIIYHYFDIPQGIDTAQPDYTEAGPTVGGRDVNNNVIPTINAIPSYTNFDYPTNWAPGAHAHASAPHTHHLTVGHQHTSLSGWNIVGAGLPAGTYKAWLYVAVVGSFTMNSDDSLHVKFEEIDT